MGMLPVLTFFETAKRPFTPVKSDALFCPKVCSLPTAIAVALCTENIVGVARRCTAAASSASTPCSPKHQQNTEPFFFKPQLCSVPAKLVE